MISVTSGSRRRGTMGERKNSREASNAAWVPVPARMSGAAKVLPGSSLERGAVGVGREGVRLIETPRLLPGDEDDVALGDGAEGTFIQGEFSAGGGADFGERVAAGRFCTALAGGRDGPHGGPFDGRTFAEDRPGPAIILQQHA